MLGVLDWEDNVFNTFVEFGAELDVTITDFEAEFGQVFVMIVTVVEVVEVDGVFDDFGAEEGEEREKGEEEEDVEELCFHD